MYVLGRKGHWWGTTRDGMRCGRSFRSEGSKPWKSVLSENIYQGKRPGSALTSLHQFCFIVSSAQEWNLETPREMNGKIPCANLISKGNWYLNYEALLPEAMLTKPSILLSIEVGQCPEWCMFLVPAMEKSWGWYNLSGGQCGSMYQNFKFVETSAQQFHFKDLIYLKEVIGQKDVCSKMFNTALFIVMKNWKHSKCPTIEDSLRQLPHTMVCLLCDCCQRLGWAVSEEKPPEYSGISCRIVPSLMVSGWNDSYL